jgi:hypothetical protein
MTPSSFFFWAMLQAGLLQADMLHAETLPAETAPDNVLAEEAVPADEAAKAVLEVTPEPAGTAQAEALPAETTQADADNVVDNALGEPLAEVTHCHPGCSNVLPPPSHFADVARFRFEMGKGFSISSMDEAYDFRIRVMAQLRHTSALEGRDSNEFSARGVRVLLEGRALERRLVFLVQAGLSPDEVDGGSGLLDAWVSWKFGRDATLRIGQQRIFYDMLSAIGRSGCLHITRENVSGEFGILRDVGLMLFSNDFLGLNELLAYRIGVYGGQGRNRLNLKRSGFLSMARVTLRPFGHFDDTTEGDVERLDKPRLALGLAVAHDSNIARTGGSSGEHFDNFAFPGMDAYYWNMDAMLKWKGFYVAGQYSRRVTSRFFVENDTETIWGRSGHGYVLKASGMLTSQWELAGRFAQQFGIGQTSPLLLAQAKNEFALGLNCYFIGHALKAQLEYSARFTKAQTLYEDWLRLQLQVVF